jgi:glycerol dehydrogenase-like iron-containing ADH family enzyme
MAVERQVRGQGAELPQGLVGPVLLLADADAIGRLAPRWAETFAALGLRYRVRLVSGAGGAREIDTIAEELARQAAGSCVAAGDGAVVALARAVAARAGVPIVVFESRDAGPVTA